MLFTEKVIPITLIQIYLIFQRIYNVSQKTNESERKILLIESTRFYNSLFISNLKFRKYKMSSEKRARSPNLTAEEKNALVDLVTKHFEIVENKRTDAVTQQTKLKEWIIIAQEFNSSCSNHQRTAENLKIGWENMKKSTRKTYSDDKMQCVTGTGGGPPKKRKEDPLLGRVMDLIRPTVEGLINPFDSDVEYRSTPYHLQNEVIVLNSPEEINDGATTIQVVVNDDWTHFTPDMLRSPISEALRPVHPETIPVGLYVTRPTTNNSADGNDDPPVTEGTEITREGPLNDTITTATLPTRSTSWARRRRPNLQRDGSELALVHKKK